VGARERYLDAGHAVQTGVALEMAREGDDSRAHKHLRVGINLRACDHTGLVKLLIAKGVITEDEYVEAMADEAELEVQRYEERLSADGTEVHLI
jgi:hypothetical protein